MAGQSSCAHKRLTQKRLLWQSSVGRRCVSLRGNMSADGGRARTALRRRPLDHRCVGPPQSVGGGARAADAVRVAAGPEARRHAAGSLSPGAAAEGLETLGWVCLVLVAEEAHASALHDDVVVAAVQVGALDVTPGRVEAECWLVPTKAVAAVGVADELVAAAVGADPVPQPPLPQRIAGRVDDVRVPVEGRGLVV